MVLPTYALSAKYPYGRSYNAAAAADDENLRLSIKAPVDGGTGDGGGRHRCSSGKRRGARGYDRGATGGRGGGRITSGAILIRVMARLFYMPPPPPPPSPYEKE